MASRIEVREGRRGKVYSVRVDLPPDPTTGRRRQGRISANSIDELQAKLAALHPRPADPASLLAAAERATKRAMALQAAALFLAPRGGQARDVVGLARDWAVWIESGQ